MKIIDRIEKLVAEYDKKIAELDDLVDALKRSKAQHRKNNDEFGYSECAAELKIRNAQRQAYYQAKIDIDSLLDHIDKKEMCA